MRLPLTRPPKNLCLLRLSAVGDISHTVPVVRTIQEQWPETQLTWIIGKLEHTLVGDIPGVEFIIFDKAKRWLAYLDLHKSLLGRRFDVLLHMQMSLRASLASLLVKADIRLGFDKTRAKDLQWLFTNEHIEYVPRQHVLDSLLEFPRALGINKRVLRWDIPIPFKARQFAARLLPGGDPVMVISPCSSMSYRNWSAERYAAIADYAIERYGMQVFLTGGPSETEQEYGRAIAANMQYHPVNLIGETSLKELLAILEGAAVLVAPDSGPAHLATAVGTPVIGLYAATNPDRARPYLSSRWVVNRYPEAVRAKYGKMPDELPWGIRVRDPGTMDRISVNDVKQVLDELLSETLPSTHRRV